MCGRRGPGLRAVAVRGVGAMAPAARGPPLGGGRGVGAPLLKLLFSATLTRSASKLAPLKLVRYRGHEILSLPGNYARLRSLGVRQVLAPCAVGGLRADVAPGDVVVPDQMVDRTYRRVPSYVEGGAVLPWHFKEADLEEQIREFRDRNHELARQTPCGLRS